MRSIAGCLRTASVRLTPALVLVAAFATTIAAPAPALAARFGPPWMAQVTADQTTLYTAADRSSPVGPLQKGAIVVVVGQQGDMTQTPDGWVPSGDTAEKLDPYLAQVTDASVSVYAKPNASSDVRKTAAQGNLLLVTGVSPGVDGDNGLWWATTEGYVGLHSLRPAPSNAAPDWKLPTGADAPHGWWGQASAANVRAGPSTDAPIVGEFQGGEHVKVIGQRNGSDVAGNNLWLQIDGGRYPGAWIHSSLVQRLPDPQPTVAPPPDGRQLGDKPWIVVDRQTSVLTLMQNGQPVFATYVSLGKAGKDTADGTYATFLKFKADRMTSSSVPNADHSYDLPNVPYTQYFKDDGSAIHGTYWHDAFGTDQSQGCINVTWGDAAYLFGQTLPQVGDGQTQAQAPVDQATPVEVLH